MHKNTLTQVHTFSYRAVFLPSRETIKLRWRREVNLYPRKQLFLLNAAVVGGCAQAITSVYVYSRRVLGHILETLYQ